MGMRLRATAAFIALLLPVTGCGGQPTVTSAPAPGGQADPPSPAGGASIIASGFGQQKEYVWITALIKNNTGNTGQSVTVNFNLLDEKGEVIKSESQVESFVWIGQELAVGTQADLDSGRVKVASVEATLDIKDYGRDASPVAQFTTGEIQLTEDKYSKGYFRARFDVINPDDTVLKDARIGVICYDKNGVIVGGSSVYPDLVPAKGKIRAETTGLIVSTKPASCKAFPGALGI